MTWESLLQTICKIKNRSNRELLTMDVFQIFISIEKRTWLEYSDIQGSVKTIKKYMETINGEINKEVPSTFRYSFSGIYSAQDEADLLFDAGSFLFKGDKATEFILAVNKVFSETTAGLLLANVFSKTAYSTTCLKVLLNEKELSQICKQEFLKSIKFCIYNYLAISELVELAKGLPMEFIEDLIDQRASSQNLCYKGFDISFAKKLAESIEVRRKRNPNNMIKEENDFYTQ